MKFIRLRGDQASSPDDEKGKGRAESDEFAQLRGRKAEKEIEDVRPRKRKSALREYGEAIIIAVILALFIRTFVVQAFKIPSGSMLPTLKVGDHILVNKFIYWFVEPKRGDIVVFRFPQNENRDFIKRIVGLPSDTIEVRDKKIFVNGQPLKEDYAIYEDKNIQSRFFSQRDNFGPVKVPAYHYFLMGDNRDNSMDSRFWGFLEKNKIRGQAFIIYWSWDSEKYGVRWLRFGKLIR